MPVKVQPNCSVASCQESESFQAIQGIVEFFFVPLSSIALVPTVLVLFCSLRLVRSSKDTIHVYVASMTLGDLIVVLCQLLEFSLFLLPSSSLERFRCVLVFQLTWIGLAISGLSLVLLNSDKLLFFYFPLRYRIIKSVRRAIWISGIVWAISIGYISFIWLQRTVQMISTGQCNMENFRLQDRDRLHYTMFMCLFGVLPVLSSFLVSCCLLRLMCSKIAKGPTPSGAARGEFRKAAAFTHKFRSLVFIFATTVWTALSLLPFRLFNLSHMLFIDICTFESCESYQMFSNVGWILFYLFRLNPIVNPFITALIYHPYRLLIAKQLSVRSTATQSN